MIEYPLNGWRCGRGAGQGVSWGRWVSRFGADAADSNEEREGQWMKGKDAPRLGVIRGKKK